MTELEKSIKNFNDIISEETYHKYFPSLSKTENKIQRDSHISIQNILKCHWFCTLMKDFANNDDLLEAISDLQNYVTTKEDVKVNDRYYKFKNGVVYSYDFQNMLLTFKSLSIIIRSVIAECFENKKMELHYFSIINELLLKNAILKIEIENMTSYEYAECAFLKLLQEEFKITIDKLQETEIDKNKCI